MSYEISKELILEHCVTSDAIERFKGTKWFPFMQQSPTVRGEKAHKMFSKILYDNDIDHHYNTNAKLGYDMKIYQRNEKIELKYASINKVFEFILNQVRCNDLRYEGLIIFLLFPPDHNFFKGNGYMKEWINHGSEKCKELFYYISKEQAKEFKFNTQHPGAGTFTMSNTISNMNALKEIGDGSLESVINKLREIR